jgi:hypothetical protein
VICQSHPFLHFSPSLIYLFSLRPGIKPKLDALRNLYEGKKIIVGRDKLDVVKGVLQKVCFLGRKPLFFFFKKSQRVMISYAPLKNCFRIILNGLGTSL